MRNKYRFTIFFYISLACLMLTILFICDAVFSKHLSYFFPFVGYGGTFRWNYLKIGDIKISLYWTMYPLGICSMCALCLKRYVRIGIAYV